MPRPDRDYTSVAAALVPHGTREERMTAVATRLWETLAGTGLGWIGFYVDDPREPDDRRLVLGPHRDRPACSPIGMHGVCGQALRARDTRLVDDVKQLGDAYVACDPADRSEIVVPLIDELGIAWGVLDLDAPDVAAFDARDAAGLREVLRAGGLLPAAANDNAPIG